MALAIPRTELLRLRLRSHGLTRPSKGPVAGVSGAVAPDAAAARMFALQGQDLPGALWSIGQRAPGTDLAQVRTAFDSGELVRSWPLRGTLHVLAAEDLGWVLALTGARSLGGAAGRERQLGLDAAAFDVAREVAAGVLERGRQASRAELFAAFDRAGVSTDGQRGVHLLWHLAVEGLLVLGPFRGAEQFVVLTEEWIPQPRALSGDEAVRELVVRYLTGRGPATLADLTWWSKLPVTAARRALDDLRDSLTELSCAGTTSWALGSTLDRVAGESPRQVLMLPGFDEFLLGYSDRSAPLAPHHAPLTVPGGNGVFKPTVVVGGRVVGLWSRRASAHRVIVTCSPFDKPFPPRVAAALASAAADYGRFHGLEAQIVLGDPVRTRSG
ncbi:Winged helix DNA-binding domain-containing protein [Sanguibacter gelidistatuariae]|uniref:Winged helix DNA-binding domain-containing protein n=1 Tax=Sanguibacter gelidistatuariae TaxID=1814289 RepID=A0A1G6TMH3_9MICO|nr:winged helix DNA-binding domain-containing protein [Sanguibacter gelidistatuariae]SDD29525.1 Winged helix DNA-binding domain-containing protein [Sanguibacter gelidistatuariae]